MLIMMQQHFTDIVLCLILAALFALAIRHMVRNPGCGCGGKDGHCSGCSRCASGDAEGCSACSTVGSGMNPVELAKLQEAVKETARK